MIITIELDCSSMDDDLPRIQADHASLTYTRPDENNLTVTGDQDAVLDLLRWWLNDDLESIFDVALTAREVKS